MAANYNNSAWFYDHLSRLIYGNAIIRSQIYLLSHISANRNILIVGGGTGWILEEITRTHPPGLNITYVEMSARMMALSHKRDIGGNSVIFINDAIENVKHQTVYDVVLTPFLFDNFTEQTLQKVFDHIHNYLKSGGIWLNTDFHLTGKWWQKLLLRSMFIFFRLICDIEASKLPGIQQCFEHFGYISIDQKSFFGDFIVSTAYSKTYEVLKTS